jgi:F0F1-type ATP synthase delta subunit
VDKLQSLTGKKILLTNKVDPACLGGAVLLMEDMQFNDSISNKLETLKNQLKA